MKGIYILLIELPESRRIRIGKLGLLDLPRGRYAYTGSAQSGLEQRIERHKRRRRGRCKKPQRKELFWHIDYLLEWARILEIYTRKAPKEQECRTAGALERKFTPIPKFGCSDCNCRSHLFFLDL